MKAAKKNKSFLNEIINFKRNKMTNLRNQIEFQQILCEISFKIKSNIIVERREQKQMIQKKKSKLFRKTGIDQNLLFFYLQGNCNFCLTFFFIFNYSKSQSRCKLV